MNKNIPDEVKIYLDKYILGLQRIYKTTLDKVILYGSYARGDYTEDSDIDIKPIAKGKEEFSKWINAYPFYANAQKEGIELFKKNLT